MNITLVLAHLVETMGSVLSLALGTFAIVLLDGQGKTVKSEITVCLIPVSIMVRAQMRKHPSNVFVLINGMVQPVINMTIVFQTHAKMEGSVKILKLILNVIVYKDGQDLNVKHEITVKVHSVQTMVSVSIRTHPIPVIVHLNG